MNRPLAAPALARPLVADIVALATLAGQARAWDALVDGAIWANPYFAPHVLLAHAATGLAPATEAVAVRCGAGLLALLPFDRKAVRLGFSRRAHRAWASPYANHATPLIARSAPEAVHALLYGMQSVSPLPWLLPRLSAENEAARLFRHAAEQGGWHGMPLSAWERPVFAPGQGETFDGLARRHWSAGRRSGLRRLERRLAERGTVRLASATEGKALAPAVESFLALEAASWKGRRGTAMAASSATVELARRLFKANTGSVRPRADLLLLDERPVAVSLGLVCGGTAHLLKIAHDETLARAAPGVLLEVAIMRQCLEDGSERLDSAAAPGGLLDELYPGREAIEDWLMAPPTIPAGAFARLSEAERRRSGLLAQAKLMRDRADRLVRRVARTAGVG